MSIISISATKAQKDGAKYLFGTKGESILSVLEILSKAKELRSSHLNGLILMLKDAEDDELIKFKNSAGGKRTIEAAKLLATAKTLGTSLKGLRGIKVPSKWIQDHDDAKAAGAEETKLHRATGKGTKPKKAEQVANPQAPESETVDNGIDITAILAAAVKVEPSLVRPYAVLVKQPVLDRGRYFTTLGKWLKKQIKGSTVTLIKNGVSIAQRGTTKTTELVLARDGWKAKMITTGSGKSKLERTMPIGELFVAPAAPAPKKITRPKN